MESPCHINHCSSMCEAMYRSVENEEFCDTIIHTSTSAVYSHAVVLSNVSKELHILITPIEGGEDDLKYELNVQTVGCSAEALKPVLRYCYTGVLGTVADEYIDSIYITAQYLGIKSLGMMCLEYKQRVKKSADTKLVATFKRPRSISMGRSEVQVKVKRIKTPARKGKQISPSNARDPSHPSIGSLQDCGVELVAEHHIDDVLKLEDDVGDGRNGIVDGDIGYGDADVVDDDLGDDYYDATHVDIIRVTEAIEKRESQNTQTEEAIDIIEFQNPSMHEAIDNIESQNPNENTTNSPPNDSKDTPKTVPRLRRPRSTSRRFTSGTVKKPDKYTRDPKVECPSCDRMFTSEGDMKKHYLPEHEGFRYSCTEPGCGKQYRYESDLKEHVITHTGKYTCTFCHKVYSKRWNLSRHILVTHTNPTKKKERPLKQMKLKHGKMVKAQSYPCSKCDKVFATAYGLTRHFKPEHEGKRWPCQYCEKVFKCRELHDMHMQRHTGNFSHKCDECDKGFARPLELDRHKARMHGAAACTCERCGKTFDYKALLKNHQITCGKETNDFECQICHAMFKSKAILAFHLKTHDPLNETKCRFCSKKFKTIKHARYHEKIIHIEPAGKYECEICNKLFKTPKALKEHKRLHDPANEVQCRYCERKFKSAKSRSSHEAKVHTIVYMWGEEDNQINEQVVV